MSAVTATAARKELFELIRRALHGHEAVHIQHRDGGVVLISADDYDGLLETLELLTVPGLLNSLAEANADVAAGRTMTVEHVLGDA
jgi:antitoxin YefM